MRDRNADRNPPAATRPRCAGPDRDATAMIAATWPQCSGRRDDRDANDRG